LDDRTIQIARYLVSAAGDHRLTNYQSVAEAIGWPHPTGRGLGKYLAEILVYCKANELPALTTIVTTRGDRFPPPEAMEHITRELGNIDIGEAQRAVFSYDWSNVALFVGRLAGLIANHPVWLTSFWGFDPQGWGCIGFATEAKRQYFLRRTRPGALVVIYVTKNKGPAAMRGMVVGILEVSHRIGSAREFIAGDRWAAKEADSESAGKWLYAIETTRAWRIVEEEWRPVEQLLPLTYSAGRAEHIGAQCVPVAAEDISRLAALSVYEVPVHGQTGRIESSIGPLENALRRARQSVRPKNPIGLAKLMDRSTSTFCGSAAILPPT